jgi:hypothetical protein
VWKIRPLLRPLFEEALELWCGGTMDHAARGSAGRKLTWLQDQSKYPSNALLAAAEEGIDAVKALVERRRF